MCGGYYEHFETPKQLTEINGETLVGRTIRLLKENGITDIYISGSEIRSGLRKRSNSKSYFSGSILVMPRQ